MRVALLASHSKTVPMPVAVQLQHCRTHAEFSTEFGRAEIAIMDLRHPVSSDPVALIEGLLTDHPFVKVVAIGATSGMTLTMAFRLGQLGLWKYVESKDAEDPRLWKRLVEENRTLSLVERFQASIQPSLRKSAHTLLTLFVMHLQAPAVKQFVHRAPVAHGRTVASRRRSLWKHCQLHDLSSPEDVLFGVRLMFIKHALDDGQWTEAQIAAHLEYTSPDTMWRSVRRRSGYTGRRLRDTPRSHVYTEVVTRFFERDGSSG